MPYDVLQWPESVYPGEVEAECAEAHAILAVLIGELRRRGPSPEGYQVKTLGKQHSGLWQINLRFRGRQIRVLYAPYEQSIVLFRIHKKSSPQEQERAYQLAARRKREYEVRRGNHEHHRRPRTLH